MCGDFSHCCRRSHYRKCIQFHRFVWRYRLMCRRVSLVSIAVFSSRWAFDMLASSADTPSCSHALRFESDDVKMLVKCADLIIVCWLPWLIAHFPGNLDPDTRWQIMQTYGYRIPFDQHPYFDTLLFGAFWHLGDLLGSHVWSLGAWSLFQCIATVGAFSLSIWYFRRMGVPRIARCAAVVFLRCILPFPYLRKRWRKTCCSLGYGFFSLVYIELARTRG